MNGVLMVMCHLLYFQVICDMLNIGKKMLCVYGFKPNHSKEEISWNSVESMTESLLSESRKKVTVRIRFFSRESQPSSSTRWWDVTLKPKTVFRRNKHKVKITEYVGTKEFSTNEGKVTFDEEDVVVRGQLQDDSIAGRYFVLRLKLPVRDEMYPNEDIFYEGTLARSQDLSVGEESWEVTHDAVVFRDQTIEC